MIHLIATFEPLRIPFLPQFVEHYSLLGVQRFHLTLHLEPCLPEREAKAAEEAASTTLRPYGIQLAAKLVKPFNSLHLRDHHDQLQRDNCMEGDWIVWADIDEFQVYPGDFGSLLGFAESLQLDYFHGYFVERVAADGTLRAFDPAVPLWAQYPRRFIPPGTDAGKKIWKVTCARPHVEISRGNHYPTGETHLKFYAEPVEIHHFRWDETIVPRLSRRLLPDFQDACPWWTESRDLLDYIKENGRIASFDK